LPSEFLHRDELLRESPDGWHSLPAVFLVRGRSLTPLLGAREVQACDSLEALMQAVGSRLREC
jgi:hypothetical protein